MKTVFVSGHMHVTDEEFQKHYAPRIDELLAVEGGTHFLVGDAPGFDVRIQAELADSGAKVTVYHMKDAARNNVGGFVTVGGFETAEARDAAMTAASEEDLAWVRPGREGSGVGANVQRRKKLAAGHDENSAYNKAWSEDDVEEDEDEDEDEGADAEDEDEDEDDVEEDADEDEEGDEEDGA